MPSSLFPSSPSSPSGMGGLASAVSALRHNDPQTLMESMARSNPQFAQFVSDNRGKSPEQIAREHGIDIDSIRKMVG